MSFEAKKWKNDKAGGTKINAAALINLEERVTNYADAVGIGKIAAKKGDLLVFDGSNWVRGPIGETGQQLIVNNDSTLHYQTARISIDAWGASTSTADNKKAIQEANNQAEKNGGGIIYGGAGTYLVKSTPELGDFVTFEGLGQGATTVKVAKEAKCSALKTKRLDEGGKTGGVNSPQLRDICFDGNLAENAGFEGAVVDLDAINPTVERVWIKGGYTNLKTRMSRTDESSTRPEDGTFNDLRLYASKGFNWLFEGPHDSQIKGLLAQTNEGVNISVRKVSEWTKCHAYGNAKFAWELLGGNLFGCIGEGASQAQCIILADGLRLNQCEFFSSGAKDGKVGIEFGDATHSANTTQISDVYIEGCTNGSFKWAENKTASNTRITGTVSQASGNIATGTEPGMKVDARGLRVTGGAVDNLNFRKKASGNSIEIPWAGFVEITGKTEIKKITATYVEHRVTLIFVEEVTVSSAENLSLQGGVSFKATAEDTLTLICDGANFFEVGRSVN